MLKKAKEAERAERQDKLINKWMQDKKKKTTRKRTTPGARAAKGAASGVRNKNPHMQQSHEIRKQVPACHTCVSPRLPACLFFFAHLSIFLLVAVVV